MESLKNNKALLLLLCAAVLAAFALNGFALIKQGTLNAQKAELTALLDETVKAKLALIAEKEAVEKELTTIKAQIETAAADYEEAKGRETDLQTEVEALAAKAEKAAKDLAAAKERSEAAKALRTDLEKRVGELSQEAAALETALGKAQSTIPSTP